MMIMIVFRTHRYKNALHKALYHLLGVSTFLQDNCRDISNTNQQDMDGDGVGDICDNCVVYPNPNQRNADNDTTGDKCDGDDDNDGVSKY